MDTRKFILAAVVALLAFHAGAVRADFDLLFRHTDFTISNTFNQVTAFQFAISVDSELVPGGVYTNPALNSMVYNVTGILANTPSGFSGFSLSRSINGSTFYSLSPDAAVEFTLSSTADLADGLQISELAGSGLVVLLNARELNQNPGRYHPPIFTLNSDGTGRLVNANNQSTFPNPPPPIGSGNLVDVQIGEEYDVSLTFSPSLTIAPPIPEPAVPSLLLIGVLGMTSARKRH